MLMRQPVLLISTPANAANNSNRRMAFLPCPGPHPGLPPGRQWVGLRRPTDESLARWVPVQSIGCADCKLEAGFAEKSDFSACGCRDGGAGYGTRRSAAGL